MYWIYILEQERFDNKDDSSGIADRLKKDYLIQTGKYQTFVAEQYTGADLNFTNVLKSKEHKIAITCLCTTSDSKYVFSGSKDGSLVKCTCIYKYIVYIYIYIYYNFFRGDRGSEKSRKYSFSEETFRKFKFNSCLSTFFSYYLYSYFFRFKISGKFFYFLLLIFKN